MRIGHKATISSDVCCIQIIEVVAGIRLRRYLRKSPYPFFIGNIIEAFVFGCRCHQRISCTCGFSCFRCFFPLPCQQISASQEAIHYGNIRFEFLVITTPYIVLQIILCQVQIIKNTLINLCHR